MLSQPLSTKNLRERAECNQKSEGEGREGKKKKTHHFIHVMYDSCFWRGDPLFFFSSSCCCPRSWWSSPCLLCSRKSLTKLRVQVSLLRDSSTSRPVQRSPVRACNICTSHVLFFFFSLSHPGEPTGMLCRWVGSGSGVWTKGGGGWGTQRIHTETDESACLLDE